jgi:hypothetical protein
MVGGNVLYSRGLVEDGPPPAHLYNSIDERIVIERLYDTNVQSTDF